jgi:hypothetical protein
MENSLRSQVSNGVKQAVDRTVDNLIVQIQPLKNTCDSLEGEVNQIINQFSK